jgi:hypothetical protein
MKKLSGIAITLILLHFQACEDRVKFGKKENTFPVIIDTIGVNNLYWYGDDYILQKTLTANYLIHFMGKIRDTIFIGPYIDLTPPPPPPPQGLIIEPHILSPYAEYDSIKFEKKLQYISSFYQDWDYNFNDAGRSRIKIVVNSKVKIGKFYPVLITNNYCDTIRISFGERIFMIMEAQDPLGNWRPIQKEYRIFCGTGVGALVLAVDESVLTLAPIYRGDYKTKLRLTLGKNHSNEFEGLIDREQFLMERR